MEFEDDIVIGCLGSEDSEAGGAAGAGAWWLGGRPRGRTVQQDFLRCGPVLLVAIVGVEPGPWKEEVEGAGQWASEVRAWLGGLGERATQSPVGLAAPGVPRLLGFATVEAWRLVTDAPEDRSVEAQAELLRLRHCRSAGMGFCRHRFRRCAEVAGGSGQVLPPLWESLPPTYLFGWASEACATATLHSAEPRGHGQAPRLRGSVRGFGPWYKSVVGALAEEQRGQCFVWPVWAPFRRSQPRSDRRRDRFVRPRSARASIRSGAVC